jgi:hypothetical protein
MLWYGGITEKVQKKDWLHKEEMETSADTLT